MRGKSGQTFLAKGHAEPTWIPGTRKKERRGKGRKGGKSRHSQLGGGYKKENKGPNEQN